MGLSKMESPLGKAAFTLNGSCLGLHPRKLLAADTSVAPTGNGFNGITLFHNIKSLPEEADTVINQAITAGAKLMKQHLRRTNDRPIIFKLWVNDINPNMID